MSFLLKITAGKNAGSEYTLLEGKNLVGRSRSSDIRVFNEDVSGKHFTVEVANGVATLQNISGYGTRVDGVLVHQSIELRSGQVIEAGKSLKFIFEATDTDEPAQADNNSPEYTETTKFVGDVQADESDAADQSEQTSVTRFAGDSEETSATRFTTSGGADIAEENNEVTSVTRFAADISETAEEPADNMEATSVTRFAADISETAAGEEVLKSENKDSETAVDETVNKTAAADSNSTAAGTVVATSFNTVVDELSNKTATSSGTVEMDKTTLESATRLDDGGAFFTAAESSPQDTASFGGGNDTLDEQGMFFEDDDLDDSERTNANETQVVQTRMASMDEINFIKSQIKKQQQGRLFFKFLIFSLFVVLLGVVWMLKSPPQEKVLSWPQQKKGNRVVYMTSYTPFFDLSFKTGGFDIYYPSWKKTKIVTEKPNKLTVQTFLGKKGEVPLTITVLREISDEFVYEDRNAALQNMLRRLSERKDGQYNFDSTPTSSFFKPEFGEWENGIFTERLAYQRDAGNSFFGVLRFFRSGNTNYIICAEVPAEEKLRALPVLNGDVFIAIHPDFVRNHWEGNDEYSKGDIARSIVGVKDELQRNSPMQYPRLEREIKSILAQSLYEKNDKIHAEAKSLLRLLRVRQQRWYNGQKIRWFSAVREKNNAEKLKVRNDCEAVFSITGDKRRYDILRDHWE